MSEIYALHDMGIRVSIDDFGTGYSSLDYLRRLPLDNLKIDKSFTFGIGQSENDEQLIKLMVSMAKSLDLEVIAEGVETEQQLEFLRELGCEKVQGYLIHKPSAAEEILNFMSNKLVNAKDSDVRENRNEDKVASIHQLPKG